MHVYVRGYCERATPVGAGTPAAAAPPGAPLRVVASTEGVARDGLAIAADGWDLDHYRKSPVVLWSHDYHGGRPPIGRADRVWIEGGKLLADLTFDRDDPFAVEIERKLRTGYLNAVSVGWETREIEPPAESGGAPRVTRAELLDISVVPVPGDPDALVARQRRALAAVGRELAAAVGVRQDGEGEPDVAEARRWLERAIERHRKHMSGEEPTTEASQQAMMAEMERALAALGGGEAGAMPDDRAAGSRPAGIRAAIPPHTTERAPEGQAWDAAAALAAVDGEPGLRRMHAWVDGEADPAAKSAYKFPHHEAEGAVVWRGVAAAMARLLQAGTDIPDADRRGVYDHLARHYRQFDRTPPEFRSAAELAALGPAEVRGLFLEGETELFPDFFAWQEQRAGKVLSARNRERLEQASALIAEVLRTADPPAAGDGDGERGALALLQQIADGLAGVTA